MTKFKNYILIVFMVIITAVSSANALEFSADMYTNYENQSQHAKIYIKGNQSKIQPTGLPQYIINKGNKSYIVMADTKQYLEQNISPKTAAKIGYNYDSSDVEKKYLGTEKINGQKAKKFEISSENGEKTHVWMVKDTIPVRVKPLNSPVVIDFKNISYNVSDRAFDLPKGYTFLSMEKMMGNYSQQLNNIQMQQVQQQVQQYKPNAQQNYDKSLNKVDQSTNNVDKGINRVDKIIDTTKRIKSLFGF